jgi:hypothetical protein
MANDDMDVQGKAGAGGGWAAAALLVFVFVLCVFGWVPCVQKFYLSICRGPKNLQIDKGLSVLQMSLSVTTDRKMIILYAYMCICLTKTLFLHRYRLIKNLRRMCKQKPLQTKGKTANTIFCLSVYLLPDKSFLWGTQFG